MIVHVDLSPRYKKKFEKLLESLMIPVSSEDEAVLVFSNRPHVYKPTVLVGKLQNEGEIGDNIIDVIDPRIDKKTLQLKVRLYEIFLQTGGFYEALEEEFLKAKRNTMPLSIVIFRILDKDIDAVRTLLTSLNISSRKSDKTFNLGEGEVVIILPGTDKSGAEVFAKRLERRFVRKYLKEKILKKPEYVHGIAELEDWMITGEDLISAAEYETLRKIR